MFDNLREEAASFYESEEQAKYQPAAAARGGRSRRFLGMTSLQRFIISVMLLLTVCIVGALCLMVTGRIGF